MRPARRSFPQSRTSTLPSSSRATRRGLRPKNARSSGRIDQVAPASCRLSSPPVLGLPKGSVAPAATEADARPTAAGWAALRRTFGRFFQVNQHLPGMALRLYLGKDVLDSAVRPDDERGPDDAHDLLAVHVLHLQNAESVGDLLVGIRQQGERQLEFVLKLFLRLGRVGRDAK